nr:hypothetical protein [Tanacetum cinerariifolium]
MVGTQTSYDLRFRDMSRVCVRNGAGMWSAEEFTSVDQVDSSIVVLYCKNEKLISLELTLSSVSGFSEVADERWLGRRQVMILGGKHGFLVSSKRLPGYDDKAIEGTAVYWSVSGFSEVADEDGRDEDKL